MLEKYEDVVVVDNVVPDSPAAATDIRKVNLNPTDCIPVRFIYWLIMFFMLKNSSKFQVFIQTKDLVEFMAKSVYYQTCLPQTKT